MFILGWERKNLSFICVSSFIYSWGVGRIPLLAFFPTFIILPPSVRRKVENEMSYDRFSGVQPWRVHVLDFTLRLIGEEIICKNRFNFKFISSLSSHHHVYYIDFDIIAITPANDDMFFPTSPVVLHLCGKSILSKEWIEMIKQK